MKNQKQDPYTVYERNEVYSSKGRKSAAEPQVLFQVLVYGYLCGLSSSWKLEEACQYRIDFRWLLEDRKAPDHTGAVGAV